MKRVLFVIFISIVCFFWESDVNALYVTKNTLATHEAYTTKNPYTLSGYYGQCTWYVWGRMYERNGLSLPTNIGNAGQWFSNISKRYKSLELQENSILVVGGGNYSSLGHVLYVEEIKGDNVYLTEGNFNGSGTLSGYRETVRKKEDLIVGKPFYKNFSGGNILGYIIVPNQKNTYKPVRSIQKLKDDFYAFIVPKKYSKFALASFGSTNGDLVTLENYHLKNKYYIWHFIRKKDGSYSITNLKTNLSLDVYATGNENQEYVQVWNEDVGDKNNWFIYEYNGGSRFVPRSSIHDMLALDVPNNTPYNGQVLHIYEALNDFNDAQTFQIDEIQDQVLYQTKQKDVGWGSLQKDGISGSTGKGIGLDSLRIGLLNPIYSGDILYRAHIQRIGWETNFHKKNEVSGVDGLRLEAFELKLTGDMAKYYDIYYRSHVQKLGWLSWAKNGASAGTSGFGFRLEAIQIKLVKKGEAAPGSTNRPYVSYDGTGVTYQTQVQKKGWLGTVSNGATSGTVGQGLRMESLKINLKNQGFSGNIEYRTHIQKQGWEKTWKKNGVTSGTVGLGLRLEALQLRLTGDMAKEYDIYYRVHSQRFGWLGWARNGESAGTSGYGYRLEGIQIVLVRKGMPAPGNTANHYYSV